MLRAGVNKLASNHWRILRAIFEFTRYLCCP